MSVTGRDRTLVLMNFLSYSLQEQEVNWYFLIDINRLATELLFFFYFSTFCK